jgi:multiple sugar transport system substrate-binding protein
MRETFSFRFVSRTLGWALILTLAGCPERNPSETVTETRPFAGQEIRLGIPADRGFTTAWEAPLNEWESQSGAKYQLVELPRLESTAPANPFSGSGSVTLALFPLEQAGELIASGSLAPIPDGLRRDGDKGLEWPDLFLGLRDKLASRKGQAMFLPLAAPVLVLYYRQDLLQAAGLKPPQTWDEYQQLMDQLDTWAPGLTAVEPWNEDFRATLFFARAASLAQPPGQYSLYFDIDTGDPLIDNAAFVLALQKARLAIAKMPKAVLSQTPGDCRAEFFSGRAALAIACEPALLDGPSRSTDPAADAKTIDPPQIGVIRLPGAREVYDASRRLWETLSDKGVSRVTVTAFSGWGVGAASNSTPPQVAAAWNALTKVAGQDLVSGFSPGVVGLCRESQLSADAFSSGSGSGLSPAAAEAVAESLRNPRLVAELPIAGRQEFRQTLTEALGTAVDGSKTAEQALQSAAAEWHKIIDRIGPARHRDNYRTSLGLSPKPVD